MIWGAFVWSSSLATPQDRVPGPPISPAEPPPADRPGRHGTRRLVAVSNYDDGSDYKPSFGPEPGQNPPPAPGALPPRQQDSYSTAALIVGILSLILGLFCGLLAVPAGIVAIYLGLQGRKRSQALGKGPGLATAGAVMGAVAIVMTLVFLIVTLVVAS